MFFVLIDHHRNLRGVVIVLVVLGKLKMPFQLAGVGIESQQGIAVQVVAGASLTAIRRRRISGGPEFVLVAASYVPVIHAGAPPIFHESPSQVS